MLVPDGSRAKIVRDCFEGMASGRFRSAAEVKRHLEEVSDVPRNAHGEIRWTFVTEMLRRSLYAGLISVERWGIAESPRQARAVDQLRDLGSGAGGPGRENIRARTQGHQR